MTGEAQHAYAINDSNADPKQQDKEAVFESLKERDSSELYGSLSENAETTLDNSPDSGSQFCIKDKESHTLREAVIRPQQAGKIDFKSLQNRSKFPSDRAWTSGKGSPQSPTGKSRAKEKNKRSGKGDRNPHQLYRLSISNCRSNPTIGIAYPQQKVTPPKKLESNRGPISGSYRFHVPSIPEREAELQQEDLTFNRSFQEASSSLTSTNYTSQAAAAVHQHHALKPQQQASLPRENSTANGQLHYPEFQANGNNCWHSSEKSFAGVNYGVPSQKPSSFSESNKSSAQGFGPMPFQYPFTPLHDAATDPFNNDHSSHPQDYIDVTLTNNQLTHGAFVFHSSGDGQEEPLSNGHYDALQPDGRNYTLSSQQTQFLHPGTQHQSSLPCYKGRSEHSTDLNGAMSSSGAIMSSGAIEQTQSTFQENHLRNSNVSIPVNKRNSTSKDNVASQRALAQSNSHRRSITQNSLPQVHFQAKVYGTSSTNNKSTVPVPFDKNAPSTVQNHSRVAQAWEGGTTGFPLIDQNSAPYPSSVENQFSFQCQSNTEQRHVPKNGRLPWQQIHLTSAMPNQNRIELSRQLSNQKLHFPLTNSEWQESNKTQKNIPLSNVSGFHNKRHLASESFPNSRNDGARHNCSTANNFSFENGVDSNPPECDSRSKNIFFGMSQQIPPASSRNTSRQQLQIPAVGLISASPYESPLPSPVLNPPSSGTSSSLSPVSSSPVNASSDDSQMPIAVPPPPFYHQQFHPKEGKRFLSSEQLNSSVPYYHHPESLRTQNFAAEGTKDDHVLNCLQDNQFHKQSADSSKECMTSFENEQPPPPPYSSHQLLANSLNSANLDQLDVLLTCKQCDQNFSNLASFLEHRQYCGLHSVCQTELKGASRMTDSRKHNLDSIKISQATSVLPSSRGSSQLQSSLFVLNKNGDFPLDGDVKGEGKDDPPKINIFTGLTASSLSLTASDLEIDDAKLDSLITEALNGLAYQSDNGEIDSSFIDVFADEEPSTAKVFGSGQTYKMKDGFSLENKIKHKGFDERQTFHTKNIYHYEKDEQSAETKNKNKNSEKKHGDKEQKTEEATVKQKTLKKLGDHSLPEKMSDKNTKLKVGRKSSCDLTVQEKMNKSETISGSKKNAVLKEDAVRTSTALAPVVNENTKLRRCGTKDAKKRKSGSGTWSKELIHKIVQQKNKLHKLHVKGNKNFQFSLVTEKLVPSPQSHKFGEYDYISDSDDEDVVPHKFSSGRRLMTGLNGRSKYSFGKRNHGQDDRSKEKEISWRYGCKDRHLQVKSKDAVTQKKESYGGRIRRRSSRSSISTPTSISSESTNSPKSTDRTDSDNDKDTIVKRRSTDDYDTLNRVNKEITQGSEITQSDFSKSTKRYGSAKFLLTSNKLRQSRPRFLSTSYGHEESIPQDSKDKYNKDNSKKENVQVDTEVFADSVRQNQSARKRFSSCEENTVNCPNKGLINDMLHASDTNADINITLSNRSKTIKEHCLCNSQQDLGTNAGCYKDSAEIIDAGQSFCDTKHLTNHYSSDMFPKPILIGSSHLEDMYLCQDDINPNLFQQDHMKQCISTYPAQHEQNRVRSPLTFDSSSMFGEFPVSGFDSQFYPNMSTSKDDFLAFTCNANQSDKSTMFEQPYPSYLQQKDWNLMEEVNPILSEGITNFPSLTGEKSLNKKPTDESTLPSNQVPLPISEKHSDYNVPFTNSMSEDELEIKRLVTELECQLQTSKLNNSEHIAQQSSKHLSTDLSDPSAQFSPLHLEQGTENGKGLFLTTIICVHQTSVNDKSTGPSLNEDYEHHDGSWTCSFPFSSLDTQAGMLTPVHADSNSLDKLYSKEEPAQCHAKSEVENVEKNQPEDKIETQKYKESLVKSLAVISDSLFSNNTLEHGPEQELPSEPFKGNQPEVCVLEEQEQKKASNVPLKELSTEASEHTKEPSTALLTERDNDLNLTSSEKSVDPKACQPQKVQENTSKEATSSPKKCLAQVLLPTANQTASASLQHDLKEESIKTAYNSETITITTNLSTDSFSEISEDNLPKQTLNSDISECSPASHNLREDLHMSCADQNSDQMRHKSDSAVLSDYQSPLESTEEYAEDNLSASIQLHEDKQYFATSKTSTQNTEEESTDMLTESTTTESTYSNDSSLAKLPLQENVIEEAHLSDDHEAHSGNTKPVDDENFHCTFEAPLTYLLPPSPPFGSSPESSFQEQKTDSELKYEIQSNADFAYMLIQDSTRKDNSQDEKTDSNNCKRASLSKSEGEKNLQADLCTCSTNMQNFEQNETMEGTAKCTCSKLLCSHYKEASSSTTAQILDFQSLPQNFLDTCKSPINSIEYMNLTNDPVKNTKELDFSISFGSNTEQHEKQQLKYKENNLPESVVHKKLNPKDEIFPSSECTNGSHSNVSVKGDDTIKEDKNVQETILFQTKNVNSNVNQDETKETKNGLLCEMGVDGNKAVSKNAPDTSSSSDLQKNTTQADTICDICSASFRSKPGLTRHKAIKHRMKNDGNPPHNKTSKSKSSLTLQENAPIVWKDGSETVVINDIKESTVNSATDIRAKKTRKKMDSQKNSNSVTSQSKSEKKTTTKQRKRQMKANRRKAKGDNSETKQNSAEEVSDDILNIIKTDLLKAITYPLQSANLFSEKDSHMEKQVNSSEEDNHGALTSNMPMHMHMTDESRIKKQQEKDGANDDEEHVDKGMCDVSKENLSEIKNTQDEHNMKDRLVEESGQSNPHSPFFAPAVESKMAKNEADILGKTFDESSSLVASQEDRKDMLMQQYKLPSKNITDSPSELPSLFDDDSTFSQLFPRDNQITRKKCTRVYGKRTKKQKAIVNSGNPGSAEALLVVNKLNADIHNDNSFCGRRPNVCVYDTISLDDALMLDMCHSSKKNDNNIVSQTYEDTVPQSKHEELHNSPSLSDDSGKDAFITSVAWDHPKEAMINASTEETSCKSPTDLKNEGSVSPSNPMSSNFIQTYDRGPGDHISSSEFHTVDIGILTTKFEIPTIPFFCSEEDKPALSDVTAPRISEKSRQNNKHNRTKSEEGKMIKNRGDINMKSKDKQYKCKVCFQWFLTLGELDFHKLSHNPSPPPTCYMCVQRKFGSREQLRDHLKEKHAKNKAGIWTCGMCLKEISDVWMYNEHLREHATQFARKGQVQKSVIGMPGCFSEDSVVKNFLSTIMSKRQSKLSKNTEAGSKSPTSKENKILKDIQEQDPKTKEVSDSGVKNKHNVSSLIKLSTNASADHMQEAEVVQKNFPIHPDCKDPSRDCHHCGKQFPKPFKLQRHLVVHSLQKIYLCHKCPIFYQETQDLRNHLKQEHGTMEEPEIKHTTLYACELCADVMHVIKKSFICSTCNYTFSKKEQYDRHMEKHLASGRKTFRFRGVIRP
uniref:Zinc finger protein 469 n=1 Tax=Latimeria chalumnae TaxID=7897 RepID=H3BFN0_LATCH